MGQRQEVIDFFSGEGNPGYFEMMGKVLEPLETKEGRQRARAKFEAAAEELYEEKMDGDFTLPIHYMGTIRKKMRTVDAKKYYAEQKLLKRADGIISDMGKQLDQLRRSCQLYNVRLRGVKKAHNVVMDYNRQLERSVTIQQRFLFVTTLMALICLLLWLGG